MKILFSGGGTLGSVMPLIAVYQELKKCHPDWQFLWAGTKFGPEKKIVQNYGLEYRSLAAAKWRRYFSWQNFIGLFVFLAAFIQSWRLIKSCRPDLLISAGGFVSVPLHLAAWFLGKTTIIHQEDIMVGLANRIMSWTADFITTAFEQNLPEFPKDKTIYLGNPVREGLLKGSKEKAISHFHLDPDLATILVLGGGTGALSLNKLVAHTASQFIEHCQIIHMTGAGKEVTVPCFHGQPADKLLKERYHPVAFLDEEILQHVLAAADLVITRAGLSTLSELSVLGKPIIMAPLPNSPQLTNAEYFSQRSQAPIFYEDKSTTLDFVKEINRLLTDHHERLLIGHNLQKIMPKEAREKMCLMIEEIAKQKM